MPSRRTGDQGGAAGHGGESQASMGFHVFAGVREEDAEAAPSTEIEAPTGRRALAFLPEAHVEPDLTPKIFFVAVDSKLSAR